MNVDCEKHFCVRDRFGKLYRCWMENCSDCQRDWDEVIELCALCFYDDYGYKLDCPEDDMRSDYLRKLFQWEYSSSGMTGEGDGGLVCVKGRLVEDNSTSTADDYKIILANTITTCWLKNKRKLPDVTKKQLQSILSTAKWEKTNIFDLLDEAASELDICIWYSPYGMVHPDFQGSGIGKEFFGKAAKKMTNYVFKRNENKSLGIVIKVCAHPKSLHVAESFGETTFAHLHFKNSADGSFYCYERDKVDGADCNWLTVAEPTNETIVNALKKKFGFKSSKL